MRLRAGFFRCGGSWWCGAKAVGRYTHFGNHYKINIQIRKKLGLDSHSTNLNLYIARLLRESEELPAPADDGG